MPNRKILILVIAVIVLLLIPQVIYYWHFCNKDLSDNPENWGKFGDFVNGTTAPLLGLTGLIVTLIISVISDKRNASNVEVEQLKQRPILHIGYWDGDEELEVFMKNKGAGPLLIEDYRIVNTVTNAQFKGLESCIPEIKNYYLNYTGNQNNTVLSPKEKVQLLHFKTKAGNRGFEKDRDAIRQSLKELKIVVNFKDVYNHSMPTYERNLSWFGRHFS